MADRSKDLLSLIREQLSEQGIDLDSLCGSESDVPVKVVCVAPDMQDSVRELGEATRDQVVMVRIDEKTSTTLDNWVETGAVRSRSEGAALFIREGLKVRAEELQKLKGALRNVEVAKRKLRRQAKEVLEGRD